MCLGFGLGGLGDLGAWVGSARLGVEWTWAGLLQFDTPLTLWLWDGRVAWSSE